MTDQHCPGFEANKSLSEITITCPDCDKKMEIFADEAEKQVKCSACGTMIDPKKQSGQ